MKATLIFSIFLMAILGLGSCESTTQPEDDIAGSVKGLYLITKIISGSKEAPVDDPYFYVQITKLSDSRADVTISNGPQISDKVKCSNLLLTRQGGNVIFTCSDPTGSLRGSITSSNINVEITGNTSGSITMQGKKQ
jgi:hypothetical protein